MERAVWFLDYSAFLLIHTKVKHTHSCAALLQRLHLHMCFLCLQVKISLHISHLDHCLVWTHSWEPLHVMQLDFILLQGHICDPPHSTQ